MLLMLLNWLSQMGTQGCLLTTTSKLFLKLVTWKN